MYIGLTFVKKEKKTMFPELRDFYQMLDNMYVSFEQPRLKCIE